MVGTAAAASGANNPKLQEEEEFGEEQTHDDFFFALHASRHNERQWTQPSLRVKRSIYTVAMLSCCAFTIIKLSSISIANISIASMKGKYVTNDRKLNLTVGRRPIIESNISVAERWNSSSQNKVTEQQNIKAEKESTKLQSDSKASRHIWIDAISYAEGIAGWKISLLELLHLAQTLDATLVEPCMTSGRLGSCSGGKNKVPVSEIFDLAKYMAPFNGKAFPLLASYDNYQAALDDSDSDVRRMVKLCLLNDPRLSIEKRCSADTTLLSDMERNVIKDILDEAKENNFILHMEDYWRGSLDDLGRQFDLMEFPGSEEFESKIIPFHSKHLQFVDDLLQRGNITSNNFSAIHWRAEKEGMNFTRCAIAVNNVKRIMLKSMSNNIAEIGEESRHRFVLLSSLNEDSDKMWSGVKIMPEVGEEPVRNALGYLLRDNGFVKIDDLLDNEEKLIDSGMLAIYDLIIASKANNFASCVRNGAVGCTESSQQLCEECNHVGKFGKLATFFRQESVNKVGSSWECWPTE